MHTASSSSCDALGRNAGLPGNQQNPPSHACLGSWEPLLSVILLKPGPFLLTESWLSSGLAWSFSRALTWVGVLPAEVYMLWPLRFFPQQNQAEDPASRGNVFHSTLRSKPNRTYPELAPGGPPSCIPFSMGHGFLMANDHREPSPSPLPDFSLSAWEPRVLCPNDPAPQGILMKG